MDLRCWVGQQECHDLIVGDKIICLARQSVDRSGNDWEKILVCPLSIHCSLSLRNFYSTHIIENVPKKRE
jgi:hypothetical protein